MNQELTFDPSTNQLTQCATVQIVNDSLLEATEIFEAVLTSNDSDISIRPFSNTIIMIRNDDGMFYCDKQFIIRSNGNIISYIHYIFVGVSARFTETSHTISEDGNIQTVCAELVGLTQIPVSVMLATQDGSATSQHF